jgi:AcrR family transcriptional regulator
MGSELTMSDIENSRVDDGTLSTEDWLRVARETLIREGINGVKIDRLAKACGVTRGGFYWRFKNRGDLLEQLLDHWKHNNTEPMLLALSAAGTPAERFAKLLDLWLNEREFSPDYDSAVRNWALSSTKVAATVRQTDDVRMKAIEDIFVASGYPQPEAMVRARITYFHQVGYYAMGVRESLPRRSEFRELYYMILSGFVPEATTADERQAPRDQKSKSIAA